MRSNAKIALTCSWEGAGISAGPKRLRPGHTGRGIAGPTDVPRPGRRRSPSIPTLALGFAAAMNADDVGMP
jgi:hypothetical protein